MAGKLNKSQVYAITWQWKSEVENGVQTVLYSEETATNAERAISKLRRGLAEENEMSKADVIVFGVQRGSLMIEGLVEVE